MSGNAPGVLPLRISGVLIAGALVRIVDPKRAVAQCVAEYALGTGTGAYRHVQDPAAACWVINHNLGLQPNVRAYSDGGREMLGEVVHTSATQTLVYFDSPVSGFAVCS